MRLYSFLRTWFSPKDAAILTGMWYAILIFLVFLGLSQEGADLRYANL